jgi:Phospholipase_D-nuclease N-terminal
VPEISFVLFLAFFGFWIWALLDVLATGTGECRNLPKVAWLLLVFFLGPLGACGWTLLGRPPKEHWLPRATDLSTPRRPVGYEDRPDFSERPEITDRRSQELDRRLEEWEAEQRTKRDGEPGA